MCFYALPKTLSAFFPFLDDQFTLSILKNLFAVFRTRLLKKELGLIISFMGSLINLIYIDIYMNSHHLGLLLIPFLAGFSLQRRSFLQGAVWLSMSFLFTMSAFARLFTSITCIAIYINIYICVCVCTLVRVMYFLPLQRYKI